MNKGEGLSLYYSKDHGSGGMYQFKGKKSVPVGIDEFLDNTIMPGGASSSSALINQLQLDATYSSFLSQGDPLSNVLNKGKPENGKANLHLYKYSISKRPGEIFMIRTPFDTLVPRVDSAITINNHRRKTKPLWT